MYSDDMETYLTALRKRIWKKSEDVFEWTSKTCSERPHTCIRKNPENVFGSTTYLDDIESPCGETLKMYSEKLRQCIRKDIESKGIEDDDGAVDDNDDAEDDDDDGDNNDGDYDDDEDDDYDYDD
eukprot:1222965-Karenia_brevis.AAC.1